MILIDTNIVIEYLKDNTYLDNCKLENLYLKQLKLIEH